jgi:ABC-type nitrate/sulfonate/bicarbonate transport system substrate-binding protein
LAIPSTPEKFVAAIPTISAGQWTYFIAEDQGWYKQLGLDMEIVNVETSVKATQALLSGSANIAGGSPDPVLLAVAKSHEDLIIVGDSVSHPIYTMVAQKDVKSFQDLKGKRIGVSSQLSMDGLWTRQMLTKAGMDPAKDVQIVDIGGTAARYAALQSGAIAAGLLTQPQDIQALRQGFTSIGVSTDIVKEITWTSYATSRPWAEAHKALLVRFLVAQRRAANWFYSPANKDAAIRILIAKTNASQQDAADTYALFQKSEGLARGGETSISAIQTMIDARVAINDFPAGTLTPQQVFAPQYMDLAKQYEP